MGQAEICDGVLRVFLDHTPSWFGTQGWRSTAARVKTCSRRTPTSSPTSTQMSSEQKSCFQLRIPFLPHLSPRYVTAHTTFKHEIMWTAAVPLTEEHKMSTRQSGLLSKHFDTKKMPYTANFADIYALITVVLYDNELHRCLSRSRVNLFENGLSYHGRPHHNRSQALSVNGCDPEDGDPVLTVCLVWEIYPGSSTYPRSSKVEFCMIFWQERNRVFEWVFTKLVNLSSFFETLSILSRAFFVNGCDAGDGDSVLTVCFVWETYAGSSTYPRSSKLEFICESVAPQGTRQSLSPTKEDLDEFSFVSIERRLKWEIQLVNTLSHNWKNSTFPMTVMTLLVIVESPSDTQTQSHSENPIQRILIVTESFGWNVAKLMDLGFFFPEMLSILLHTMDDRKTKSNNKKVSKTTSIPIRIFCFTGLCLKMNLNECLYTLVSFGFSYLMLILFWVDDKSKIIDAWHESSDKIFFENIQTIKYIMKIKTDRERYLKYVWLWTKNRYNKIRSVYISRNSRCCFFMYDMMMLNSHFFWKK